jgi:hypothetical protein
MDMEKGTRYGLGEPASIERYTRKRTKFMRLI